ncbi:TIGR02450 family Trp-rich protein [Waterburya agarophytonicola K14]|uniref:TIGR02450 family Trp-rich protein n=1 Tax=Waterburya agarophytonicola KI4 TaxID=2874699 RepID=A0A964BT58_9CYAN|nr:TIGR02450 family Trp-rich protein [Waterburya agarophytonicola]MCC0178371.1 TIGR02450 family Trp-rich protein [Waterburya agarophytonicola KI4]
MSKKRKQKFPFLVGSKWTAIQKTWGWRHFQVIARKNQGKWIFAEMVSSCDPQTKFWLNAIQLKDDSLWLPGWKTIQEIEELEDSNDVNNSSY